MTGKAWIIKTYGKELFERAIGTLPREDQAMFRMELVGTSWYPIRDWTRVLDAVRAEVRAATGEDAKTFDRRLMFESIGTTMNSVFRIAFALLSPMMAVAKVTPYFQKVYSHGLYAVVENEPGRCRVRLSEVPHAMADEVLRAFPLATSWVLDIAGQDVTKMSCTRKTEGLTSTFEVAAIYEPKRKR